MVAMERKLTIGQLSQKTGVPVKTLRFYSDEGLLPPSGRSRSGYRLYTEEQASRIGLIRTLREAGIGLETIAELLRRDVTLGEVLAMRLEAVETHIAGLERVASALRLAIRSGANERHLRRISMATRASNAERRKVVAAFYEKVVDGLPAPREWTDRMIETSAPDLPDQPSSEQLEAWMELEGLLDDPGFMACKRANAADTWAPRFDADVFLDAQHEALTAVSEARSRGLDPSSGEAGAIVERFTSTMAAGGDPNAMRAHMRVKYDPRGARQWELVAILRQDRSMAPFDDWRWLGEALRH
jgi:DNA-binding transcriptional MerR regulator